MTGEIESWHFLAYRLSTVIPDRGIKAIIHQIKTNDITGVVFIIAPKLTRRCIKHGNHAVELLTNLILNKHNSLPQIEAYNVERKDLNKLIR
jgi:hypothetical protein